MNRLKELTQLLDAWIEMLQRKLHVLQGIADCVQRADLEALEELMEQAAPLEGGEAELDSRLDELREALGRDLGVVAHEVTLGRLAELAPGQQALELSDRRERLGLLLERTRQQAQLTSMLVSHAVALNSTILGAACGGGGEAGVYDADGRVDDRSARTVLRHCV